MVTLKNNATRGKSQIVNAKCQRKSKPSNDNSQILNYFGEHLGFLLGFGFCFLVLEICFLAFEI